MDCARICRQAKRLLPSALAVWVFLLLSAPGLAGEVYSFSDKRPAARLEDMEKAGLAKGRLLVEGTKYRIEYGPSRVVVSKDGGEHEFSLDLQKRTYYEPEKTPLGMVSSPPFRLLPLPDSAIKGSVSNVKLDVTAAPQPEELSGIPVRRHDLNLSYEVVIEILPPPNLPFKGSSEFVHGKVKVNAVYWMAEDRAPLPVPRFRPEIRTGFAEVDGRIAGALAALRGLMVKEQVSVVSEGDQGVTPRSQTSTMVIEGVRPIKTEPAMFEVPSGFKYHKPEIVGPGMETPPSPPM
jgi:hypothetical protein